MVEAGNRGAGMGHSIRLFVAPWRALSALVAGVPQARIVSLAGGSDMLVLPVDDDLHDAMHAAYGTGEWLEHAARLSTSDVATAARASKGSAIAYLETDYSGGAGMQCAAVWHDGELSMKPAAMSQSEMQNRAPQFWPVNAALRSLGVAAQPGEDEFTTFGLARFRSNEAIIAGGLPTRRL